ncbi:hypothetical protein L226DRAFT_615032 [Lentinus tigrinus ALCF2SS1-7]|uniref:uncharacterized protein n=1 Tax=Lentinus tigrinus ALCF2SS1-7 TaxID=1328758 RepID=UPI001165D7B2|nr:hypothetical protein L226DRAFT_615032 [Lentinus tigrinus ALCF2SS1-7]
MAGTEDTMGWLLVGVLLSAALWGVSLTQMYSYYIQYPADDLYLKSLVASVSVMETMHQGTISYTIYSYLVTDYANQDALNFISKALVVMVILEAITALIVQSFFAMRIYRLSSKRFVVLPVVGLIVTEFGVSLAYSAKAYDLSVPHEISVLMGTSHRSTYKTFPELNKIKGLSLAMNASAALTDVTIAIILCTILQCSKTGNVKSNRLVNKLIAYTVNTGLLTSTCACVSLITYLALPGSFVYICFFLLMGRLYSNSLLATLNARERLREDLTISFNEISIGHMQSVPPCPVRLELDLGETPKVASTAFETHQDLKHSPICVEGEHALGVLSRVSSGQDADGSALDPTMNMV